MPRDADDNLLSMPPDAKEFFAVCLDAASKAKCYEDEKDNEEKKRLASQAAGEAMRADCKGAREAKRQRNTSGEGRKSSGEGEKAGEEASEGGDDGKRGRSWHQKGYDEVEKMRTEASEGRKENQEAFAALKAEHDKRRVETERRR